MKKKSLWLCGAACILFLTSCGNIEESVTKIEAPTKDTNKTITSGRVDASGYDAMMENGKYPVSPARGLSANRLNSNYNLTNFEDGLLRLSERKFSVNDYYFSEGQKLSEREILNYIGRRSNENPNGLNAANGPIVLQQIAEQDFIGIKSGRLEGVSIGLALNTVDYSGEEPAQVSSSNMIESGQQAANELLAELRKKKELTDIPIQVSLFKQASKEDLNGGNYIYTATSENGSKSIDKWTEVNEQYIALPVLEDNEKNLAIQDSTNSKFTDFKNAIQGFFPELSGVTGIACYEDSHLDLLSITIEVKFYGVTELKSFTQYVGKTADSAFSKDSNLEIQIKSVEGTEAFVARNAGEDNVYTHVFR